MKEFKQQEGSPTFRSLHYRRWVTYVSLGLDTSYKRDSIPVQLCAINDPQNLSDQEDYDIKKNKLLAQQIFMKMHSTQRPLNLQQAT